MKVLPIFFASCAVLLGAMYMRGGHDVFEGIEQVQRSLQDDKLPSVGLPLLYTDASAMVLLYRVSPSTIKKVLPSTLEPMTIMGEGLASVFVFEFRNSTIGAYNEIGIGLLAKTKDSTATGRSYIWNSAKAAGSGLWVAALPVTTYPPLVTGEVIWGFDKYISDIKVNFENGTLRSTLKDELEITATPGYGVTLPGTPIVTLTRRGNKLHRTIVTVGSPFKLSMGSAKLKVLGKGRTADVVKTLGLDQMDVSFVQSMDDYRMILPVGEDVADF